MSPDEKWRDGFNKMPVTGSCDAGCGKSATVWFGLTSCATCGDSACVKVLQDSYDCEGEHPDFGPAKASAMTLQAALAKAATAAGLGQRVERLRSYIVGMEASQFVLTTHLQQQNAKLRDRITLLEAALRENHEWHKTYDEHDGYAESGLEQTNLAALNLDDVAGVHCPGHVDYDPASRLPEAK